VRRPLRGRARVPATEGQAPARGGQASLAFWLSMGLPARRDRALALSWAELWLGPYGGSTLGPLFHGLQRRRRHTVLKLAFQKPYL
jgi:hypothetical protein